MNNHLEKVLSEIPQFLQHFSLCLLRPRRFIHAELQQAEQEEWISKGVEFLILSFLIALFISQVLPEAVNPVTLPADDAAYLTMASQAVFDLFLLFFIAVIAFSCWRIVGVNAGFWPFFRLFAYFCGVTLVLLVFANALTNIAMIDPVVAKSWIQLEQSAATLRPLTEQMLCETDSNTGELLTTSNDTLQQQLQQTQAIYEKATNRPLFLLGNSIQALVYLVLLVWLSIAWTSYGKALQLSTGKIIQAGILTAVFVFIAYMILTLVQSGSQMMAIYRACG
jgi:hypothetical protein